MPTSGAMGGICAQALQLLDRPSCSTSSGMSRGRDLLAQVGQLGVPEVGLAQLGLDGLHLLAQVKLALVPVHFVLHLRVDVVFQLQHVQLAAQQDADALQARGRVEGLQDGLALAHFQVTVEATRSASQPGSSMFIAKT